MTLFQDLRFALRMLLKDPWFTVVAATALGLGIGVNTTVFTFVNAVLIRGLPFERADEIVYLATHDTTRDEDDSSAASWQEFEDWRAKARSFSALAAFRFQQMNISDPEHPAERVERRGRHGQYVFGLLGQQPFLGRDFAPGEDAAGAAPVVIIGYSIWKNRYGSDTGVIGRALKINEVAHTIIGVMPEGMRFPTNADMWRPLLPPHGETRRNRFISVFGRLAPRRDLAQAAAEMAGHLPPAADDLSRHQQEHRSAVDDVQRTLQRRAHPAGVSVDARRGRIRAADRLRERREPAAGALGVPGA